MTSEHFSYGLDGRTFAGRLYRPSTPSRGGVLVCHEGAGPGPHAWERAARLAQAGFTAYAPDLLGGPFGSRTAHVAVLRSLVGDPPALRARTAAALAALRAQTRAGVAAFGFCFGGTAVLELARSGEDLACAVSFHGGLASSDPAARGRVKARVVVLAGAADPFAGPEDRSAFEAEMTAAGADWEMVVYAGAEHAFTNPAADPQAQPGCAYHPQADGRSWTAALQALEEAFGGG